MRRVGWGSLGGSLVEVVLDFRRLPTLLVGVFAVFFMEDWEPVVGGGFGTRDAEELFGRGFCSEAKRKQ